MKSPHKTLYLIDASIYIFRAWHTLPATITDLDGHPVNAVYGFSDFLSQIIEQTKGRYLVCAFDKSHQQDARKIIYPEYKANRSPAPADLKKQFRLCQKLCELFGLRHFNSNRYEADDIIGTLTLNARQHDVSVSIITADKDLSQFIRPGDEYWNFAKNLKLDYEGVRKRFGVRAEQIADMLALCGDKVDNIPGIPGVGEATAARLLIKWKTLDNLLSNTEEVAKMKFRGASRISNLLDEHESTVRLARKLTGLFTVEELPTSLEALERMPPNPEILGKFLSELGFSDRRQARLLNLLESSL